MSAFYPIAEFPVSAHIRCVLWLNDTSYSKSVRRSE